MRKFAAFFVAFCAFLFAVSQAKPPPYLLGVHVAETEAPATFLTRLERAAKLGARAVRVPVDWAALEPEKRGTFDPAYLSEVRARFLRAEELGLLAVLLLSQSPPWASGSEHPPDPPRPEHYADFAGALVQLVAAVGPSRVAAVEVWNEPNSMQFWGVNEPRKYTYVLVPLRYARAYAGLLNATYDAMKRRFPTIPVLGGSLAGTDLDYLKALFKAGARMDALAVHPYTSPDERDGPRFGLVQYPDQCNEEDPLSPRWCFARGLDWIRAWLDAMGRGNLELWLTEFGAASGGEWGEAGSEAEQAKHLEIALDLLEKHAPRWKVRAALWYRLVDEGDDRYGLLREDGSKKPAAEVFKRRAP